MFTIGIFTTHIPYIAFVVFYAFFLVTGVNKAVAGEISVDENFYKTEFFASETLTNHQTDIYQYLCKISDFSNYKTFEDFIFRRKFNYPEYSYFIFKSDFYLQSVFCRPPPVI